MSKFSYKWLLLKGYVNFNFLYSAKLLSKDVTPCFILKCCKFSIFYNISVFSFNFLCIFSWNLSSPNIPSYTDKPANSAVWMDPLALHMPGTLSWDATFNLVWSDHHSSYATPYSTTLNSSGCRTCIDMKRCNRHSGGAWGPKGAQEPPVQGVELTKIGKISCSWVCLLLPSFCSKRPSPITSTSLHPMGTLQFFDISQAVSLDRVQHSIQLLIPAPCNSSPCL